MEKEYYLFTKIFTEDREIILYRKKLKQITGRDIYSALFLSQLVYYYMPQHNSDIPKGVVMKDGKQWVKKSLKEWSNILDIPQRTLKTSLQKLEKKGIITRKSYGKGNQKKLHISLNINILLDLLFKEAQSAFLNTLKGAQSAFLNSFKSAQLALLETYATVPAEAYVDNTLTYTPEIENSSKPLEIKEKPKRAESASFYIYKNRLKKNKKEEKNSFPTGSSLRKSNFCFVEERDVEEKDQFFQNFSKFSKISDLAFLSLNEEETENDKKKSSAYYRLKELHKKYPTVILRGFEYKYARLYSKVAKNVFDNDYDRLDKFIENAIKYWDKLRLDKRFWFLKDKPQPRLTTILSIQFLEEYIIGKKSAELEAKNKKRYI